MKQKFLPIIALLLMAATGAKAETVTWTVSDMTDLSIDFHVGSAAHNTIKSITVTASGGGMGVWQANNISMDEGSATITFTSSVGNIKSIAITAQSIYSYGDTPSGWTLSDDYRKLSWSGDASPTVSMTLSDWSEISNISEIVFTIESTPAASTYSVTLAEGTEDADKWTIEPKTGLNGGETVTVTYSGEKKVKSVKAVKKANNPYANAKLGDLFYSDGTFSSTLVAGKTPIGVIAYLDQEGTDDDEICEKSNGAGHGLVLCLKDAASAIAWSTEISAFEFDEDAKVADVNALKRTTNVSGYTNTKTLAEKTDAATKYKAAYAAKSYTGLTAPTGTTGWFLPSAQQWVKMQTGLGALEESSITWDISFDNNHEGADKWEAALSKAGSGKYDSMTSVNLWYWSSSEYSAGNAVNLNVCTMSTGYGCGFSWYYNGKGEGGTNSNFRVRPVLAF